MRLNKNRVLKERRRAGNQQRRPMKPIHPSELQPLLTPPPLAAVPPHVFFINLRLFAIVILCFFFKKKYNSWLLQLNMPKNFKIIYKRFNVTLKSINYKFLEIE